ncbi:MAG: SH2 domain-containing protein [Candidatus Rhabdochlamydia sp.]
MVTSAQTTNLPSFVQVKLEEIHSHSAWHSDLTGSEAEALLRNMPDMTYVLRQGEKVDHFYLTYVKEETLFVHIPFTIDSSTEEWFYRNSCPHFANKLSVFIPEIMHQEPADCFSLAPFGN